MNVTTITHASPPTLTADEVAACHTIASRPDAARERVETIYAEESAVLVNLVVQAGRIFSWHLEGPLTPDEAQARIDRVKATAAQVGRAQALSAPRGRAH